MAILGGIGGFPGARPADFSSAMPVGVIVVFSAAATLAAIAGGILVFGDPLGSDALDGHRAAPRPSSP